VLGVAEHAELELRAGDHGQGDRAVETLVLLGIVLLQANLKLDRLGELAGLLLRLLEDEGDAIAQGIGGELAASIRGGEASRRRSARSGRRGGEMRGHGAEAADGWETGKTLRRPEAAKNLRPKPRPNADDEAFDARTGYRRREEAGTNLI
jgi:hypothetical protein